MRGLLSGKWRGARVARYPWAIASTGSVFTTSIEESASSGTRVTATRKRRFVSSGGRLLGWARSPILLSLFGMVRDAPWHRARIVQETAADLGFSQMLLPAYSPDLNPQAVLSRLWPKSELDPDFEKLLVSN